MVSRLRRRHHGRKFGDVLVVCEDDAFAYGSLDGRGLAVFRHVRLCDEPHVRVSQHQPHAAIRFKRNRHVFRGQDLLRGVGRRFHGVPGGFDAFSANVDEGVRKCFGHRPQLYF